MLTKKTTRAMQEHAKRDYPRECCGIVLAVGRKQEYVPCRNMADGTDTFSLDPEDFSAAEERGTIQAIVHSHPNDVQGPSASDRVSCQHSGLPWYIMEVWPASDGPRVTRTHRIEPSDYSAPLIGRPFFHGTLDCYGLIRDWYQRERGIVLLDFDRDDKWWHKPGASELYLSNFHAAGFRELSTSEPLEVGDVILMQHMSPMTNHGGVYVDSQLPKESEGRMHHRMGGMMLHHLYGRPSERVLYGGYWLDITRARVRYEGLENA